MADERCTCFFDDDGALMYRNLTCPYPGHAEQTDAPSRYGNRLLYIGLLLGLLLYGLLRGGSVALGWLDRAADKQAYWALDLPTDVSLVALAVPVVAMVLLVAGRTRKLGAGLILSLAAGLFVDGASYAGQLIAA
jgi:hypothetical protein